MILSQTSTNHEVFDTSSFRALCTGEKVNKDGELLCYIGTQFHRVVAPEYIVQGGLIKTKTDSNSTDEKKVENGDETDDVGQTIYGHPFELENVTDIDSKGLVCLAHSSTKSNKDEINNGSQFFVTLQDGLNIHEFCPSTVVGKVVKGLEVLELLQDIKVDVNDKPVSGDEVTIVRCGELELKKKKEKKEKKKKTTNEKLVEEPVVEKEVQNADGDNVNHKSRKDHCEKLEYRDRSDSRRSYHPRSRSPPRRHYSPSRHHSPPRRSDPVSYQDDEGQVIVKGRGSRKYQGQSSGSNDRDDRRYNSRRYHDNNNDDYYNRRSHHSSRRSKYSSSYGRLD